MVDDASGLSAVEPRDDTARPLPRQAANRGALNAPAFTALALAALALACPVRATAQGATTRPAAVGRGEEPVTRSLDSGWRFRQAGGGTWRAARVPGVVHTDLLRDSLISDPFYSGNEPKLQWIGLRGWEYATTFDVPPAIRDERHVELVFHGLDTYADVRLNGRPLLHADNMFRTWSVDVTRALRASDNRLHVVFRSPIPIEDSLAAAFPYRLPAGNDPHATRVFTRKAAYQYGWDWGPRFVTAGIWRPVTLVAWSTAILRDAFIQQRTLSDARATLTAHVTIQADTATAAALVVRSPTGSFPEVRRELRLVPGTAHVALDFSVPHPRRWWPNGLGPHPLYTVRVELQAAGIRDTLSRRIGLRTVEVVNQPDAIGTSFYVRVNGVPVFMKGANYIPQDAFPTRVDSARYAALFRDVVDSHMNMLRVWGGGIYERDLFYRMADENGILVWQEFMFANGMYPVTPAFLANVKVEATQQVKRLRNHASLALWCGNNEIREGWENWGWQKDMGYSAADSAAVWAGYVKLFRRLLPSVVDSLDPGRFYWETSPSIGWGHAAEAMTRGDSHYWGVWGGLQPFDTLRVILPRFMSEFGFQSYPPLRTIDAFAPPASRAVGTRVMALHQKALNGDHNIRVYMARWFRRPKDFASFVYVSEVLQALGLKIAFEAERRAMPRTMGSLYWQLDDSWPVVSWSSRDYYGRWKALQYTVRRAFAPILVSPVVEGDDVGVHLVSDLRRPVRGTLAVRALTFDGRTLFQATRPVTLPADTSLLALSMPLARVLAGASPARVVLAAQLTRPDGSTARNLLYFRRPKGQRLPEPRITTQVRRAGAGFIVDVSAVALARDVHLSFVGVAGHFSDDYFDLLPGEHREVRFTPAHPVSGTPRLTVRSLVDAF